MYFYGLLHRKNNLTLLFPNVIWFMNGGNLILDDGHWMIIWFLVANSVFIWYSLSKCHGHEENVQNSNEMIGFHRQISMILSFIVIVWILWYRLKCATKHEYEYTIRTPVIIVYPNKQPRIRICSIRAYSPFDWVKECTNYTKFHEISKSHPQTVQFDYLPYFRFTTVENPIHENTK